MKKRVVFFPLLLCGYANAQGGSSPPDMKMCGGQIKLYCKAEGDQKDFREVLKCLVKNDDKLSTECKQEIQRFVQASRQTAPPGGGPLGALGGLTGLSAQIFSLSYDGRFSPSSDGTPKTPSFTENNLNVSIPVFKTEKNTVAFSLGGGNVHFSEPVTLSSGVKISADFYRADAGLQYSRRLEDRRMLGVRGSFGYAGDKLDKSTESFSISANYSLPGSNESYWVFMVMMSNNSPLGTFVPIPGFFYIYRTPTFTGLFGLPILSMQWTPMNPWSYSLSIFGPTIKAEAAYGAVDRAQFFAGLGWKQQRYILSERRTKNERLTVEEKNAEIGLRRLLIPGVFSELQAGYTFDRSMYAGEGLFNKDGGKRALEANWQLRWSFRFAF